MKQSSLSENLKNVVGVEEAAEILGLSPGTVKNKAAASQIPAKKIGKQWIFDKKQLEAFKMSKFNQLNHYNSTIITVEGVEYRTTQDPYLLDTDTVRAHAVDAHDDEYMIEWSVISMDLEMDEIAAWDNPVAVEKL